MERFDDIDFDTDLDDDDETGMSRFFSSKMKVSFFHKMKLMVIHFRVYHLRKK